MTLAPFGVGEGLAGLLHRDLVLGQHVVLAVLPVDG
jgi:hypothetical protein